MDQTGRHIFYGNWPGLGDHLSRLSMNQNSRKQSEAHRGRSDPSHPATPASRRRNAEGNVVAGWPYQRSDRPMVSAGGSDFDLSTWLSGRSSSPGFEAIKFLPGTDGSNPASSSGQSVSRTDPAVAGREPREPGGYARLGWRRGRQRHAGTRRDRPNRR